MTKGKSVCLLSVLSLIVLHGGTTEAQFDNGSQAVHYDDNLLKTNMSLANGDELTLVNSSIKVGDRVFKRIPGSDVFEDSRSHIYVGNRQGETPSANEQSLTSPKEPQGSESGSSKSIGESSTTSTSPQSTNGTTPKINGTSAAPTLHENETRPSDEDEDYYVESFEGNVDDHRPQIQEDIDDCHAMANSAASCVKSIESTFSVKGSQKSNRKEIICSDLKKVHRCISKIHRDCPDSLKAEFIRLEDRISYLLTRNSDICGFTWDASFSHAPSVKLEWTSIIVLIICLLFISL